jgi:hypothetical protein
MMRFLSRLWRALCFYNVKVLSRFWRYVRLYDANGQDTGTKVAVRYRDLFPQLDRHGIAFGPVNAYMLTVGPIRQVWLAVGRHRLAWATEKGSRCWYGESRLESR